MYICNVCTKTYKSRASLRRHVKIKHDNNFSGFSCQFCSKKFVSNHYCGIHQLKCKMRNPNQSGGMQLNDDDYEENTTPPTNNQTLLKEKWHQIKTYFKHRSVQDVFNFRLINQKKDLSDALTSIWIHKLEFQCKLQCSLGLLLQHKTTRRYRYFHSCFNNSNLFEEPLKIRSLSDIIDVAEQITSMDLENKAQNAFPSSEWVLIHLTNLTFTLDKTSFPKIGKPPVNFPNRIKRLKSVNSLLSDGTKRYDDNLCFFRALSIKLKCNCKRRCNCRRTHHNYMMELFQTFLNATDIQSNEKNFKGVTMEELTLMEEIFNIKVTVYTYTSNNSLKLCRQSFSSSNNSLNLLLVKSHFCLITDLNKFLNCYECPHCTQCFRTQFAVKRHQLSCAKNSSKLIFGSETFHPPKNIFEEIEQFTDIVICDELKFYPYRVTFDIECYLPKSTDKSTSKITFDNDHKLMSLSVCSNIPEYNTPVCLVSDGDSDKLVENFVQYLEHLSETAAELCRHKYTPLINQLKLLDHQQKCAEEQFKDKKWSTEFKYKNRSLSKFIKKVEDFYSELPVLSFNGQKYDLNVIRAPLIRHLSRNDKILFAIKRNNALKCLKTSKLKFLDIVNFIAPGFNYDNFIKAYGCAQSKAYFCYEYVDSLERLNETSLPPHSAFYSKLRQSNITSQQYTECQKIWREHDMCTLKDFLVYYNNLDVSPFLEAIEKQHAVYREKGIDMFKDGVSVPSLATKWLYKSSDTSQFSIPLITKKNADLHKTIRQNLCGGPALIFHRHHSQGETKIKEDKYKEKAKVCQKILGYDANALYLHAAMQRLPTGAIIRRKKSENFRPVFTDYYGRLASQWLEFMSFVDDTFIAHKYNTGEVRLGQHNLPVDGFSKLNKTVYQFHGCLFHGCPSPDCAITKNMIINPLNNKPLAELHQDTIEKENYLKALGYKVVTCYECRWNSLKKDPYTKQFIEKITYREMSEQKTMTESEIIDAVREDRFYGFVEVDISVPSELTHKFQEMPPIFKNVNISRNDLSDHMRAFAEANKIMPQPQRSLIGSMFGKKILILTTLLKWYLQHGLVVSNVYQVIQFQGKECFSKFGKTICDIRREGDHDPAKKIIAETAKLSGNVIYGTTITDKERFTNVKYMSTSKEASKMVNNKRFISLDELASDVFEVQLAKSKIKLDTPIVLGFAILQLAKLRMLEFYYDLMCKYFCDSSFQYVCMDTDSAYFAMSGTLESQILPRKKSEFFQEYDKWFVPTFCVRHKENFVKTKAAGCHWVMHECCREAFNFHKRTPGLFKEEFEGIGIVALNAKTYHCWKNDSTFKTSTKGVMKKLNDFRRTEFLSCLKSKRSISGINKGIILKRNKLCTYTQIRSALSYFYAKRRVASDGVSTSPIHL